MRTSFGAGLVQQAQHHRVHRDGFTRTGGTGHQQMRHLGQIDHHRLAADVFAQRQRQRRFHVVVFVGAQNFRKKHDLLLGVGNFQADHVLARNHVDHAHADHGKAARDVLVQTRYLAAAHAGSGLQFEARDHRARINADHFRFDAEILELQLHLTRQHFQRFFRIARPLLRRFVQQGQRRQLAGLCGADEQRNLRFHARAFALHHRRGGWLDTHGLALGLLDGLGFLHYFALGACLVRGDHFRRFAQLAAEPAASLSTPCPVRSITRNQDSPVASVTAIKNSASNSKGAPFSPKARAASRGPPHGRSRHRRLLAPWCYREN